MNSCPEEQYHILKFDNKHDMCKSSSLNVCRSMTYYLIYIYSHVCPDQHPPKEYGTAPFGALHSSRAGLALHAGDASLSLRWGLENPGLVDHQHLGSTGSGEGDLKLGCFGMEVRI